VDGRSFSADARRGTVERRSRKPDAPRCLLSRAVAKRVVAVPTRQGEIHANLAPVSDSLPHASEAIQPPDLKRLVKTHWDFVRWVRAGTDATGVDLTEQAIARARERLQIARLTAQLQAAVAENLPFKTGAFDNLLLLRRHPPYAKHNQRDRGNSSRAQSGWDRSRE